MKYIYRFLEEQKFEYGQFFLSKTKLEKIRSELKKYEKYEDNNIVNFHESKFIIY